MLACDAAVGRLAPAARACAPRRRCHAARCVRAHAGSAPASEAGYAVTLAQRDACSRFLESARPADRLLEDAFAVHLLGGDDGAHALASRLGGDAGAADVVVARCLDAALLNAAAAGGVRQVVVAGHGADTRAFRLLWPASTCVFELGPHDALAHAELTFHSRALRPQKGTLLRRVAADVSGAAAAGDGWAPRLLAAGFLPDRPTAWALQGLHLLPRAALLALLHELGGVAAMGSAVTGEVRLSDAAALGTLLAQCGFQLDAAAPLREVAEGLGRPLPAANGGERAVFSATKTRLTGVQHERLQEELERAEVEGGEEGFADAP